MDVITYVRRYGEYRNRKFERLGVFWSGWCPRLVFRLSCCGRIFRLKTHTWCHF